MNNKDRMIIKGDFLRDGYSIAFEEWQNKNGEIIEAIIADEGDLLDSFKWYCKILYHDYETNHPEIKTLDKRTRKYKRHLKNKDVCKKIMSISEGFSFDDLEEQFDNMSEEIEKLYDECPDKNIVMEAAYMAQIYVYAAKCLDYYKKRYYVVGKNINGAPLIDKIPINLDDILDVAKEGIEIYETPQEARVAMREAANFAEDSCIIRCRPVLLDGDFEPVQVRLVKILDH